MSRIKVLDKPTQELIAAGEVIERPASVLKELIENALDAGARSVVTEVDPDPAVLVRVSDDGHGIEPDQALLALERYATSKLASGDDLWRLTTLGFRGEALPSIAAVSRFELVTRVRGAVGATRVSAAGPGRPAAAAAPGAQGTTVTVRDLFFNTPARLKFLRTSHTELARCTEVVTALALSRPDVAFRHVVGGRQAFATPGGGDLRQAVAAAFGAGLALSLVPVAALQVDGLVSATETRSNRSGLFTFINGRWARNAALTRAVIDACAGWAASGRYPVAFVRLTVPPDQVDHNVHPAKTEVRLRDEGAVYGLVRGAIARGLQGASAGGPEARQHSTYAPVHPPAAPWGQGAIAEAAAAFQPGLDLAPASPPVFGPLEPLGVVGGTYLCAAGPDGLYLLDIHAAHERMIFESLALSPEPEPLLVPQTVELAPWERGVLEQAAGPLSDLGFRWEPFGPGALLRAVPAGTSGAFARMLLLEVLAAVAGTGADSRAVEGRRAVAACRAAVKAREALSSGEQRALLAGLAQCQEPWRCPHGRPTLVRMGLDELARRFGRPAAVGEGT